MGVQTCALPIYHGHPSAATANLSPTEAEALFAKVVGGRWTPADAELFRAQLLTELAAMSVEDGMVMQIHHGACRNHNHKLFESHGPDKGCDIPIRHQYVQAVEQKGKTYGTEK